MDKAEEADFREFVTASSAALLRRAYVLVGGDAGLAEDLLQATLVKVAARWRSIDEPYAYARMIMYHEQATWWRRGWRRWETPSDELPDDVRADASRTSDIRVAVRAAMAQLTPRQRAALFLRFFEDLPEEEAAAVLGCSVGTVRSTIHRALARLRQISPELSDLCEEGDAPSARRPISEALS